MRPPRNIWPDTDGSRGALFFAQQMREMLTQQSFESFRALSLDTLARLDEAICVLNDVQLNRIPRIALEPIWDELEWSLRTDPVVKLLVDGETEIIIDRLKNNKISLSEAHRYIVFLKKLLFKEYKKSLEQKIISIFAEKNRRIELREASSFYCSHIINLGYSRTYVLRTIEKFFFSQDIRRFKKTTFNKFFSLFDGKRKKFTVYTPISSEFGQYLHKISSKTVLEFRMLSATAKREFLALGFSELKYLKSEIVAHDECNAVDRVDRDLSSIHALTFLEPKGLPLKWEDRMYVLKNRSTDGAVIQKSTLSFEKETAVTSGHALKAISRYSKKILENFDDLSTERLLNSIGTSALARKTVNPENQLVSLWSAVEILLSEPEKDTARIMHYVDLLVPCVCIRHIRRQAVVLFDEMLISYRRKFKDIMQKEMVIDGQDSHTKFTAILLLQENKKLQDELCSLCAENPLALHRLWKFQKELGSPDLIHQSLLAHERRVRWQIQRIYRTRNNLVHAGNVPNYLDSLILNASEYFRSTITTIVNRAQKEENESSLDQIISEIGIEYTSYMNHMKSLEKTKKLSVSDLLIVVDR